VWSAPCASRGATAAARRALGEAIAPPLASALEAALATEETQITHLATLGALSASLAARDDSTGGHTERVAGLVLALARTLGYRGADLHAIEIGALLHDIGKIAIPVSILNKPARSTTTSGP